MKTRWIKTTDGGRVKQLLAENDEDIDVLNAMLRMFKTKPGPSPVVQSKAGE